MNYNSGNARRIFYTKWNKLREEYLAAGMEEDAIQKLYEYDLAVFNNDRAHHRYDVEIPTESDSENQSDLVTYEKATTVMDTYHETKTSFAWVGEITNEKLLAKVESLSPLDLKILTLYVYAGYTEKEIAEIIGSKRITIHKRISKISFVLKNF